MKTIAPAGSLAAVFAASPVFAQPPQPVPEVVDGFAITPLVPLAAPTALAFGPGDADGPDLYVAALLGAGVPAVPPESAAGVSGVVFRISLVWTPAGPVATSVLPFAFGFSSPLGVIFDEDVMYVSDSHPGAESGRTDGRVTRLDPGVGAQADGTVIVDGLPNGRHNTNHLRFGPGGRLYMANGNPNDNGVTGGDADVFPYSGAILSVDPAQVSASPAVLRWRDGATVGSGNPIAPGDIAGHSLNVDFANKVQVLASGFRNVFGIAFSPAGVGYTAMNGADAPSSQDALFRITPGTDYGFPFCYNVGPPGGTGANVSVANNPLFPTASCGAVPPATALLGWHTCTTGLDFPSTGGLAAFPAEFQSSVFVGECAFFFAPDWLVKNLEDPENAQHNTSHKVARVVLDPGGNATEVRDFVTGLVLATDVLFGPDGAMYIADAEGIFRVAPVGS